MDSKVKKIAAWAVVDADGKMVMVAQTRQEAREFKLPSEKIVKLGFEKYAR